MKTGDKANLKALEQEWDNLQVKKLNTYLCVVYFHVNR